MLPMSTVEAPNSSVASMRALSRHFPFPHLLSGSIPFCNAGFSFSGCGIKEIARSLSICVKSRLSPSAISPFSFRLGNSVQMVLVDAKRVLVKRVDMEERYEPLKELGSRNFGVARLAKDKKTGELVALKYIKRGKKIDENVQREIISHRSLRHPNIVRFKEVLLTPSHLAIVLEYAAGGELFERICTAGRFSEDEARYFFQQLLSGVSYCHSMEICHRDLKLENTLLDGNPSPRLKICDFGYSKYEILHSQPKSTVGTPAYIALEVLSRKEYDGKIPKIFSVTFLRALKNMFRATLYGC